MFHLQNKRKFLTKTVVEIYNLKIKTEWFYKRIIIPSLKELNEQKFTLFQERYFMRKKSH